MYIPRVHVEQLAQAQRFGTFKVFWTTVQYSTVQCTIPILEHDSLRFFCIPIWEGTLLPPYKKWMHNTASKCFYTDTDFQ